MEAPSPHAIAVLVVTCATFFLYTRSWLRIELVSLLSLAALLVLFYEFPYAAAGARYTDVDVFRVFGHPGLVAICSLMVMAKSLTATGAIEPAVRWLLRAWQLNRWLGFLATLLVAGLASAFINDTPVLVLMLPLLLRLARLTGLPASKTLLPVNYAILCGGMLTSVGTSTNLLVLNIASDLGMQPMGLFSFSEISLVAFGLAIPYLWLVAPTLLPSLQIELQDRDRVFEARVTTTAAMSRILGRTFAELAQQLGRPIPLQGLHRHGQRLENPTHCPIEIGDAISFRDTVEGLQQIAVDLAIDLFDPEHLRQFSGPVGGSEDIQLAELVLGSDAEIAGRTLRESRFADRYKVIVVGLSGGTDGLIPTPPLLADTRLQAGDVLLVKGSSDRIQGLRQLPGLLLLDASRPLPRTPKARRALAIMASTILVAALQFLPIHVAAFGGVVALLLTRCLRIEEIGRALSLEVVLLVAASLALGQALVATGAAGWIATGVAAVVSHAPPAVQVASFMGLAAFLTNFVSNSAAAAIGTPIAVETALQLHLPLEAFVLAILFGANLSYATPVAYQTNLMVMKAAGYRFRDFVRTGMPLVLLMLSTLSLLLARRYGL